MNDICVYIDADNISYKYFKILYNELKDIEGMLQNIYVYADWSKEDTIYWLNICKKYSLIPIMATKYSGVKESSDMLLVLDIMEHLYTLQHIKTYCIVSSDSDFTHIINRLKMNSKQVLGFGMSEANITLKNTYHRYISLDLLKNNSLSNNSLSNNSLINTVNQPIKKLEYYIYNKAIKTINKLLDTDGDFNATKLNDILKNNYPIFDYRNYGFTKFSKFLLHNFKNKYNIKIKRDGTWFEI